MYLKYNIKNNVLVVEDDKEKEHKFSNNEFLLKYLENQNDVELLTRKAKEVEDIKNNISFLNETKKNKPIEKILMFIFSIITIIFLILKPRIGLILFGICSLIILELKMNPKREKLEENDILIKTNDLLFEIAEKIESIKKQNNYLFMTRFGEVPLKENHGVIRYNKKLEEEIDKKIENIKKSKNYLEEEINVTNFKETENL